MSYKELQDSREFHLMLSNGSNGLILGNVLSDWLSKVFYSYKDVKQFLFDEEIDFSTDHKKLMEAFHKSKTEALMVRYAIGFSPLACVAAGSKTATLQSLRDIKDLALIKYSSEDAVNRHRLKVFPACSAIHMMPKTKNIIEDLGFISYISEIINNAYNEEQREIQEMLGQNLSSALILDDDSWRHFWLPQSVLDSIADYLIVRRSNYPLLTTGAVANIQFLVYYDIALFYRSKEKLNNKESEYIKTQREQIGKIFQDIENLNDDYSFFLKNWLSIVLECCKTIKDKGYGNRTREFLPPQMSELLMGWKCQDPRVQLWSNMTAGALAAIAINKQFSEDIVGDKTPSNLIQKDYGVDEAKTAIKKLDEFFETKKFHKDIFERAEELCDDSLKKCIGKIGEKTSSKEMSKETNNFYEQIPFREVLGPGFSLKYFSYVIKNTKDFLKTLVTFIESGKKKDELIEYYFPLTMTYVDRIKENINFDETYVDITEKDIREKLHEPDSLEDIRSNGEASLTGNSKFYFDEDE